VILVNLGTPSEPSPAAVRRFLREFLTDRRVIEAPAIPWRICLEVCILPVRSRASAAKYASVWYPGGSPILVHSRDQAAALAAALDSSGQHPDALADSPTFVVRPAMRYGSPAIGPVMDELSAEGVRRILVVPMYPQYSQTTVATIYDALAAHLAHRRDQPELRLVRSFPTAPRYVEALAGRVEATWREEGRPDFAAGERLVLSFHGLPVAMVDKGDPYRSECLATAAALRARLAVDETQCLTTFQSKFGPARWLPPATIDTVRRLGAAGTSRVDVFCPGFVADCLETLEEIQLLNREAFTAAGGGRFVRIPCLNADPAWIDALAALVLGHTDGWTTADAGPGSLGVRDGDV
jgi:ferrochelatase